MKKPEIYDFGGVATKYNIRCSDGKTIAHDAFKDDDGKKVPLVWNHQHNDPTNVIGHAILEHRDDCVYAYCSFNDTEKGQTAKKIVKHKDIVALSICANQLKMADNMVMHGVIRELSLVLAGANPGASIEFLNLKHADDSESDEAYIVDVEEDFTIEHNDKSDDLEHSETENTSTETSEENSTENKEESSTENKEENKESEENSNKTEDSNNSETEASANEETNTENNESQIEHSENTEQKKSIEDVLNTMNEEQLNVCYFLVGAAAEAAKSNDKGEESDMKQNAFDTSVTAKDKEGKDVVLNHAEQLDIITEAIEGGRKLKDVYLEHGVTGIENLLPEYQTVNGQPKVVNIEQDWVDAVMNGINHAPFEKIKSMYFDITADEARAKGWLPANAEANKKKLEETILAFKRTTEAQMVYKRQSITRDDEISITDFNVVAFIKSEMRGKLREEIARAILVGDGRTALAEDKIKEDRIRPIASDTQYYSIQRVLGTPTSTKGELASLLVDDSVRSMEVYKGSGNITLFVRRDVLSEMVLLKDLNQRRIYKDVNELATAMLVNRIVPVPANVMGEVLAIGLDLRDYTIGSNPAGSAKFFDDFDMDFNKQKYLIEQKCSGANTTPYSALVFKQKEAEDSSSDSSAEE